LTGREAFFQSGGDRSGASNRTRCERKGERALRRRGCVLGQGAVDRVRGRPEVIDLIGTRMTARGARAVELSGQVCG
jgi:hypothetical protein